MDALAVFSGSQDIPPTIPGGSWVTINFIGETLDTGHHHKDSGGESVCNGGVNGALATGSLVCRFEEFDGGSQLQVRPYFIKDDGSGLRVATGRAIDEKPAQSQHDNLPHDDPSHRVAVTHVGYPIGILVPKGCRLRFEGSQQHNSTAFATGQLAIAELTLAILVL